MKIIERTGAQVLVDQLKLHGVGAAFTVPGESFLAVLDALYDAADTIKLITCRQEGGAAYAAEAYGKLTGKPGIAFVTRGPGATNASIGVHAARQDSTPMILFVGQVPRAQLEREAFQEIDYRQMFGSIAKWASQIEDARRIPEYVSRAFHIATSGRPGPVVLALPEDMQIDRVTVADAVPYQTPRAYPAPADMERIRDLLAQAQRPLMIAGYCGWTVAGIANLRAFVAENNIPVAASFRCQDLIDNECPQYVGSTGVGGNPQLDARVRDADLLLLVGTRPDALTVARYGLMDVPRPRQKLVHVYPDGNELGKVYQADVPVLATLDEFAAAARQMQLLDSAAWSPWLRAARREYEAYIQPTEVPGAVNFGEVLTWLAQRLPTDAIITNGAGVYTAWCHRFGRFYEPFTQLAPIVGSMGYGVPAAVAAKVRHPERIVVSFAGDGCFLMNGQELATAMMYGLNFICVIVNNNMLGTIRLHQERHYPGRVSGTTLVNPDFADYARAFGAHGEVVVATSDFPAAFERALASGKPALIELRVDPEALSPTETLSGVRSA